MLLKKRVPISFLVNKIKLEIIYVVLISVVIGFLHKCNSLTSLGFLKNCTIGDEAMIPVAVPTIIGTAISILLAFRTNQAYDRWWEARKVCGALVNDSRSLIRQVLTFTGSLEIKKDQLANDLKETICSISKSHIAFCYVLGEYLRREDSEATIKKYLSKKEQEEIWVFENKPNAIIINTAKYIRALYEKKIINDFQLIQLDQTLSNFTVYLGKCERIKNTPFPQAYTMFLHALIYLFVALLPLALLNLSIFEETLLCSTISLVFLTIEKTALAKEDPFEGRETDIPLTSLANTIERSLMEMISKEELPDKTKEQGYFIL